MTGPGKITVSVLTARSFTHDAHTYTQPTPGLLLSFPFSSASCVHTALSVRHKTERFTLANKIDESGLLMYSIV